MLTIKYVLEYTYNTVHNDVEKKKDVPTHVFTENFRLEKKN